MSTTTTFVRYYQNQEITVEQGKVTATVYYKPEGGWVYRVEPQSTLGQAVNYQQQR